MRVAILGDYPLDLNRMGGGVEAVVSYLASGLQKFQDLDLHVVTLREDIQQRDICEYGNLTVHYLPAAYRFGNVTFFAVNRFRLLRELIAIEPDVIHAHVAGTYAEVAYMTGLPTVLTPHGIRHHETELEDGWFSRLVRRPLVTREERAGVRGARHIIAISPYIQEEFSSLIRAAVYPIENPVAEGFFELQGHEEEGRILYVGRIDEGKSVHHLIQAMTHVRDRTPGVRLYLAGGVRGEAYWRMVCTMVDDLGLKDRVHFLGWLDEDHLFEEYERCAFLVLPSRQETAPMVIQQAMAAGKSVVATRVGGIPYLVDHGRTGLLVDYGDVEGLADAISQALSDGALRRRMGQAAREEALRRFKVADIARRTRQVYYTVLEESDHARHRWLH
jgi:glycosyltransferase involved in cell wall biosynthesis